MRKYLFAALLFMATACETEMPQKTAQLDFNGPIYTLNVTEINVAEDYQTSKRLPHVEGLSDITPVNAVKQWVAKRLVATGTGVGYAEMSVKDAHILKKELPKEKSGIEGYFTSEQTEEYDGALAVEIKIYDGAHVMPVATAVATSHSMQTLGEDSTPQDRRTLYHDMTVEMVKAIEPVLDRNIRQNFGKYLVN